MKQERHAPATLSSTFHEILNFFDRRFAEKQAYCAGAGRGGWQPPPPCAAAWDVGPPEVYDPLLCRRHAPVAAGALQPSSGSSSGRASAPSGSAGRRRRPPATRQCPPHQPTLLQAQRRCAALGLRLECSPQSEAGRLPSPPPLPVADAGEDVLEAVLAVEAELIARTGSLHAAVSRFRRLFAAQDHRRTGGGRGGGA